MMKGKLNFLGCGSEVILSYFNWFIHFEFWISSVQTVVDIQHGDFHDHLRMMVYIQSFISFGYVFVNLHYKIPTKVGKQFVYSKIISF